jgi:ADP-ribose pyrophosphatase YjhB (NUDIX family)
MTPAQQMALWADKLRDIAAVGLQFSKNVHDEQAFRSVQTVAMEMLALATGESWQQIEPLRASVFSCPTPFASGDAAVIDDAGRILLIRRADNGTWAMPGGALEVGETAAEGTLREVLEETGVHCRAVSLVGVFDSRLCGTVSRHHLYHFVFLCKPLGMPEEAPSHAVEVLDTGWFSEDDLPEELHAGHKPRIAHAFSTWHGECRAFFDAVSDGDPSSA